MLAEVVHGEDQSLPSVVLGCFLRADTAQSCSDNLVQISGITVEGSWGRVEAPDMSQVRMTDWTPLRGNWLDHCASPLPGVGSRG